MAVDISVHSDERQQREITEMLRGIPGGAERATARAMNRAMEGARTEAVKAVTETYYISAGDVRDTIRIDRALPNRLHARMVSRGRVIALQRFKVSRARRKGGILIRVRRDSSPKPLEKAFMPSRIEGIFQRIGQERLPIERLSGPAVPSMISTVIDETDLQERTEERFIRDLQHEVGFLLSKGAGS